MNKEEINKRIANLELELAKLKEEANKPEEKYDYGVYTAVARYGDNNDFRILVKAKGNGIKVFCMVNSKLVEKATSPSSDDAWIDNNYETLEIIKKL